MGQVVKYEGSDLCKPITLSCHDDPNNPSRGLWKNMKLKVCLWCLRSVFEQHAGHCHHSAGRKTNPLTRRMLYENTHVPPPRRFSHILTYATMNNTLTVLTVHVASQSSAHAVCKSSCHLSTFQQDRLKGDSHTLFPPSLFFLFSVPLSLSFSLLCVFVLDDQAVGWSVWPHWPLRLGWRKFANG